MCAPSLPLMCLIEVYCTSKQERNESDKDSTQDRVGQLLATASSCVRVLCHGPCNTAVKTGASAAAICGRGGRLDHGADLQAAVSKTWREKNKSNGCLAVKSQHHLPQPLSMCVSVWAAWHICRATSSRLLWSLFIAPFRVPFCRLCTLTLFGLPITTSRSRSFFPSLVLLTAHSSQPGTTKRRTSSLSQEHDSANSPPFLPPAFTASTPITRSHLRESH